MTATRMLPLLLSLMLLGTACNKVYGPAKTDPLYIGTNSGPPPTGMYYAGYTVGYVAGVPLWLVTLPLGFVDDEFPGLIAIPSIAVGYVVGYALCAPVFVLWELVTLPF